MKNIVSWGFRNLPVFMGFKNCLPSLWQNLKRYFFF